MKNNLKVENRTNNFQGEIIIVSNYFNPEYNLVVNWCFDKEYLKTTQLEFNIGVWKIKQLKK